MPYLAALVVTVVIEVPIYLSLGQRALSVPERSGLPWYLLVNVVSHPVLWFGLAPAGAELLGATAGVLAAEAIVALGEGLALARLARLARAERASAVAVAAIANAASFGVGLALSHV